MIAASVSKSNGPPKAALWQGGRMEVLGRPGESEGDSLPDGGHFL